MKRANAFLLCIIVLFACFAPVGLAAGTVLSVSPPQANGTTVTLQGSISSGDDKQITYAVLSPMNSYSFIGQATSATNGQFTIVLNMEGQPGGVYTARFGGEGVAQVIEVAFPYTSGPVAPDIALSPVLVTEGSVTVAGSIRSGADKQVTIKVLTPSDELHYIGQTTSGAEGAFQFQFPAGSASGVYQVEVGGTGVSAKGVTTYTVPDTTPPTLTIIAPVHSRPYTTNDSTPEIRVKAEQHATIKIYEVVGEEWTEVGSGTGAGDTEVSIVLSELSVGNHRLVVVAEDDAQNQTEIELKAINISNGNSAPPEQPGTNGNNGNKKNQAADDQG